MRHPAARRTAFSLTELVVVVGILAALAALVIPMMSSISDQSHSDVTRANLFFLRDLIVNRYWADMNGVLLGTTDGYPRPNPASAGGRQLHPQLVFLFYIPAAAPAYNPITKRGWNGPYMQHAGGRYPTPAATNFTNLFGLEGDPTVTDSWGNPIVLQRLSISGADYSRLVSAGPDGIINTPAGSDYPTKTACGDDLVLYLRLPDMRAD